MKINDKEYKYNLNRTHVFKLSMILEKINLKPKLEGQSNEIEIGVNLFNQVLSRLHYAELESLSFIASAYKIEEKEVIDLGYQNEIKLWKNIFDNEKDFFMNLLELKNTSKKTLSTADTTIQN